MSKEKRRIKMANHDIELTSLNNNFDQSFNRPHQSIVDANKAASDLKDAKHGGALTYTTESCTATPERIRLKKLMDEKREERELQIAIHGEHLLPD